AARVCGAPLPSGPPRAVSGAGQPRASGTGVGATVGTTVRTTVRTAIGTAVGSPAGTAVSAAVVAGARAAVGRAVLARGRGHVVVERHAVLHLFEAWASGRTRESVLPDRQPGNQCRAGPLSRRPGSRAGLDG